MGRRRIAQRAVIAAIVLGAVTAFAQGEFAPSTKASAASEEAEEPAGPEGPAAQVQIQPRALDEEIRARLEDILRATGWFANQEVRVQDGVVFLEGQAHTEGHKKWAGDLARSTRDVAVVVNRMDVPRPPVWDFRPAMASLRELARGVVRSLPVLAFSVIVLGLAWLVARITAGATRRILEHRAMTPFLREVVTRATALAVFVVGLYIVLRVAGLTTVAMTVMGGTGLLGLILGIAFRGITENFLASIFLSLQQPFRTGDLVQITDVLGYVQRLTNRATVLMTLDGNHVQIPNTLVYQSAIRNYTSNPNRREDFCIGIGYSDAVPFAQKVASRVLAEHPAVLQNPEPWVLVDNLGKATVNLRVYFWLDGSQHSWLKVRSSVIRSIKRAFQTANISMPDEARELIFPRGVPVRLLDAKQPLPSAEEEQGPPALSGASDASDDEVSARAEAGLHSEASDIEAQARRSRSPEEGENLLETGMARGARSAPR